MAAVAGKRRIEHFAYFGARREPGGDFHRARVMAREAHGQRAQSAERKVAVVRRRRDAQVRPQALQRSEGIRIGDHGTE